MIVVAQNPGLRGAWNNARGLIEGAIGGGILAVLAGIGILLIAYAVIKFFWDKRRGNGGNSKQTWFLVGAGALLSAHDVLIPFVLGIIDWAIVLIMNMLNFFTGRIG